MLTPAKFRNLSDDEKQQLVDSFKIDYLDNNMTRNDASIKYNIDIGCLKYIVKTYSLKKDRKQVAKNVQKSLLSRSPEQKLQTRLKYQETYNNFSQEKKDDIRNRTKQTCIERYDVDVPARNKEIHDKMEQTCLDRYGVKNTYQSEICKEKSRKTKQEKYNNPTFVNSNKIKNTWNNKSLDEIKTINDKRIDTNLKKYGFKNPFSDKEFMSNIYVEKFGVDHPWKSDEVRKKISNTIKEKYGVPHYCMTKDCKEAQGHVISKINQKFGKLLKDNNINFEYEFNIDNRSYDFKIDNNILLEINPTYTHNSTIGPFINGKYLPGKDINYHLDKTLLAQKNNYKCIHVFDNDDWNKIIYLLKNKNKLYARNCIIKEVSKEETNKFLNLYHLQNTCKNQSIRLGLYYNNELIQIMTFGKPRYNKSNEYELLRLCSHKDYIIIGGAERLFKHFIKENNPKSIISYCDNSKFSGSVYEKLGFKLKRISKPVGNWYKDNNYISDSLLRQRGYDQLFGTNYGKGTSNEELMIKNGWVQVFNCGQKTYIYNI